MSESTSGPAKPSIAQVLDATRTRLDRVTPAQARAAVAAGAVLVDIRPVAQREAHGEIDGALVIDRNVLEWRLDPTSEAALPIASYNLPVIVVCQQGYASSLAAAQLQDVGVSRATDLIGGHDAWVADSTS